MVHGYRWAGNTVIVSVTTDQCVRGAFDGLTYGAEDAEYRFRRQNGAWRSLGRSVVLYSDGVCGPAGMEPARSP